MPLPLGSASNACRGGSRRAEKGRADRLPRYRPNQKPQTAVCPLRLSRVVHEIESVSCVECETGYRRGIVSIYATIVKKNIKYFLFWYLLI